MSLAGVLGLACGAVIAAETELPIQAVSASSHDGNVPVNTLDGSLRTRWSAKGDGQWITYDLGMDAAVTSVMLAWHEGDRRTARFQVLTSRDGVQWNAVYSGRSSGRTLKLEGYDVADSIARHVRVVGFGNTRNQWNSITETVLLGVMPPIAGPPPEEMEAVVPVVAVSASSHDGNVPANTLDNDLGTRWSARGPGQWIQFDLGQPHRTTSIDIAWHSGDERVAGFEVMASADGKVWVPVYTGQSGGRTTGPEPYDIEDALARHVRIVGFGNTKNEWNSITEVRIYALAAAGEDDPATTPPGTPPAPGNPPWGLPSQVLDLTKWKLTLPVNTERPGNPDEIPQPQLAAFEDPEYFHVAPSGDAVIFRAPCGGDTTGGSSYPRSELREMTGDGRDKASWSTASGTHTMEIVQAITHLPEVKRHVVAGQIHDGDDDVVTIRLEDRKLFIDLNGEDGPVLDPNYELGTVFTVRFVARNGAIECYYNGRHAYTHRRSVSGCYFKAGCYTQSNTSRGDAPTAYGEVVIHRLAVTHE